MRLHRTAAALGALAVILAASPRPASACSCNSKTIELISPQAGGSLPANGAIIGRYPGPSSLDSDGTSVPLTIEAEHIAAHPVGGCMTPYVVQRPAQPLEVGKTYSIPSGFGSGATATFTVTPALAPSTDPIEVTVALDQHEPFEHRHYYCAKPLNVHQSARVTLGFSKPEQVFVIAGLDYKFGTYVDEEVGYYGAVVSASSHASPITLPIASAWCDKCIKVWVYDLLLGTLLHEGTTCLSPSQCVSLDAGISDAGVTDAGVADADAGTPAPPDAGAADGTTDPPNAQTSDEGCTCVVASSHGDQRWGAWIAVAAAVVLASRRRRRPTRC